ncbi:hypothetical protein IGI37_001101 [Enterococcus sp. AZ194]|uniref:MucBP domain-containing protein n=1 Tax=Enterococcus sp. AZ194 TaxID=2774629 RepID=UPI003F210B74
MKKTSTIISLGILLSSSLLPVFAVAETTTTESISSSETAESVALPGSSSSVIESSTLEDTGTEASSGTSTTREATDITSSVSKTTSQSTTEEMEATQTTSINSSEKTSKASDDIATGVFGTSAWRIDAQGVLSFEAGTFDSGQVNHWKAYASEIKKIVFNGPVKADQDSSLLFANLSEVTEFVNLNLLDTSEVYNMSSMFSGCEKVLNLDLTSFDTSEVYNMSSMFSGCEKVLNLDLTSFDTSNVSDMSSMFFETSGLEYLNVSSFDTSKVKKMSAMFSNIHSLKNLDLTNFQTSQVTDMHGMFENDYSLQSLDLTSFDTSNVTDMGMMFSGCQAVDDLDISTFNTSKVRVMYGMFQGMKELTNLNVTSFDTSSVTMMDAMFAMMDNLISIDVTNFDTSSVTMMSNMFSEDKSLESLDLSSFDTSQVKKDGLSGILSVDYFGKWTLKELTLGPNFNFQQTKDADLPLISETDLYTGNWQTIGDGTVEHPNGQTIWSSDELMINYNGATDAETYVWQPKIAADITVKYQDTNGNKIAEDVVKSGNIGDAYTTEQKDIKGYTFKEVVGAASGKFTDKAQTVTYVYTKDPIKAADITVKYQDAEGNKIAEDVVKSGNIGDAYTTEQKDIKGYTFKEVVGAASGKFTDKAQTVTYVYTKDPVKAADITVKYQDTDGNKIAENVVKSGNIGEAYTTEQKDIKGYTFKEVVGAASGKFTDKAQTVTYVYTKDPVKAADITVKYQDADGNKIAENVVKSGNIGEVYTTEQKDIKGYTFKEVVGNVSGKFTDKAQTVTYVYTKDPVKAADIIVKYQDTDGNKIAEDVVKSGNIGNAYTTEQKDIKGYTFKEVVGAASGKFTDKAQTVTYVYTKDPVKAADITVKYQDTDGNKIAEDVVKSGNIGDAYTTEQKDIKGYTFKEVVGAASGKFTDKAQTVTYVYTKDPVKAADITVKYQDTDGNKIAEDVVKSGNIGDAYTTEQKDIKGYTFKEVVGAASGKFTDKAQTVTYVYTKDPVKAADITVKYQDADGNKIAENIVKSGNIGDAYTTEQKDIKGYTFKEVVGAASGKFTDKAQTVTYVYTKDPVKAADITVKYQDTDGNKIAEDVVKSGNIGEAYTTEQKDIKGYTFKEVVGAASGKFTDKAQTVTYVYTKDLNHGQPAPPDNSNDDDGEVDVHYRSDSGDEIIPDKRIKGPVGNTYTSEPAQTLPKTGEDVTLSTIFKVIGSLLILTTVGIGTFILNKKKD